MAAELSLLSLTQLQKLAQSQQNQNHQSLMSTHGSWVWNPKGQHQHQHQQQPQEAPDDDSWEVKAFAEDTGNVMGTTWPPRSYTCTFCRREFRSAQALGGHMNVHRRDRARLHQTPPSSSTSNSPCTQEFATNGGLCLLYQLPTVPNNGVFNSSNSHMNPCSMSPYPFNNLMPPPAPGLNNNSSPSLYYSINKAEPWTTTTTNNNLDGSCCKEASIEELDLELRLGHRPTT